MFETHFLNSLVNETSFSGVISVRQGGTTLYERAAGYADRSNAIPNNLATRFGLASGTKFFTALAVIRLIAEGKLRLEDRLSQYLQPIPSNYAPDISIEHLLTHTSGIPDYYDEEIVQDFENFHLAIPWFKLRSPGDYLPLFPDLPMKFAPGERFSYCNGGYVLLALVIETVTQMSYQEFVSHSVFQPAGMDQSGFFWLDRLPPNTALGYIEQDGLWRTNVFNLPNVGGGDGGAYSTVGDLARLWSAFWQGKVVPLEWVQRMCQPDAASCAKDDPVHYGMGVWIRRLNDGSSLVTMSGADAGVSFRSGHVADRDLTLTVISNTSQGAWPIWQHLVETALTLT